MSERLEITKEAVLNAASKCPTAKEVLKELFPDAFPNKDWVLCHRQELCGDWSIPHDFFNVEYEYMINPFLVNDPSCSPYRSTSAGFNIYRRKII